MARVTGEEPKPAESPRTLPICRRQASSRPTSPTRPNPRTASNAILARSQSRPNARGLTDFVWQWGQFLDHDIDLTGAAEPAEPWNIPIPAGDPWFDPDNTGTQTMTFNRSAYDPVTGTGPGNPRQRINQITTWIDASNLYGSDATRAAWLRANDGTGKMRMTSAGYLMHNDGTMPNVGGTGTHLYVSGDVRANENVGLLAMHTFFSREHNRLAEQIKAENPAWNEALVYERARKIVGAQMQVITYNEFLPALLGDGFLEPYSGYDDSVNPGIENAFSTAAYRLGHSMLSPQIRRLDESGRVIPEGNLALRDAFFNPDELTAAGGIEPILRGLASQVQQETDNRIADDVRNFLFGPPGAGGFDLASLNIQRGRDHGLPHYNQLRIDYGLDPVTGFDGITSDATLQGLLESLYGDVNDIDPWVGALAEDHVPGASVGQLIYVVLHDQFRRLRDADRFWYELEFTGDELAWLRNTTLSDVILRNTAGGYLPKNVFVIPEPAAIILLFAAAAIAPTRSSRNSLLG